MPRVEVSDLDGHQVELFAPRLHRHLLGGDEARRVPIELGLRRDGDLAQDAIVLVALLEPEQPVGLQQDVVVGLAVRVRV